MGIDIRVSVSLYQRWRSKLDVVLRQEYKAGEKVFVDWAGSTIPVYDRHTGIAWQAPLFEAPLGASSYTWAEATRDQQMEAWLQLMCMRLNTSACRRLDWGRNFARTLLQTLGEIS